MYIKINDCAISGAGTIHPSEAPEFTPVFRRVRVAQSLVFCVMFCPSFFNLRILITPLVSSNSSIPRLMWFDFSKLS
jgi:hypothetical protein